MSTSDSLEKKDSSELAQEILMLIEKSIKIKKDLRKEEKNELIASIEYNYFIENVSIFRSRIHALINKEPNDYHVQQALKALIKFYKKLNQMSEGFSDEKGATENAAAIQKNIGDLFLDSCAKLSSLQGYFSHKNALEKTEMFNDCMRSILNIFCFIFNIRHHLVSFFENYQNKKEISFLLSDFINGLNSTRYIKENIQAEISAALKENMEKIINKTNELIDSEIKDFRKYGYIGSFPLKEISAESLSKQNEFLKKHPFDSAFLKLKQSIESDGFRKPENYGKLAQETRDCVEALKKEIKIKTSTWKPEKQKELLFFLNSAHDIFSFLEKSNGGSLTFAEDVSLDKMRDFYLKSRNINDQLHAVDIKYLLKTTCGLLKEMSTSLELKEIPNQEKMGKRPK